MPSTRRKSRSWKPELLLSCFSHSLSLFLPPPLWAPTMSRCLVVVPFLWLWLFLCFSQCICVCVCVRERFKSVGVARHVVSNQILRVYKTMAWTSRPTVGNGRTMVKKPQWRGKKRTKEPETEIFLTRPLCTHKYGSKSLKSSHYVYLQQGYICFILKVFHKKFTFHWIYYIFLIYVKTFLFLIHWSHL